MIAVPLILLTLPVPAAAADAPLPPGAVRRLGDTRFRPGNRVTHLAFSPDGTRLASWGNWLYAEDRLSVWDVATGREVRTQRIPEGMLHDLCWGPDGRAYAALRAGSGVRVWAFGDPEAKPPAGNPEGRIRKILPGGVPTGPTIGQLAVSPDGERLAVFQSGPDGTDASVAVYDARAAVSGSLPAPIAVHKGLPEGACAGLRFARGNQTVVVFVGTGKGNQAVVSWDTRANTLTDPVTVLEGVRQGTRQSVDVAEDGSALAVGLADGTVKVFALPGGRERLSVKAHDGPKTGTKWSEVSAVKFVNGGRHVLSAGRDNRQVVWDAKTGAAVADLNGHGSWVEAVATSPDGRLVATTGQDSLIRVWDAATWKPVLPPHGPTGTVWRLEVSRDGRYAAAADGKTGYVWDLATGRELRRVPAEHGGGYLVFAPADGILVGNKAGGLTLYPLPAGAPKPLAVAGKLLDFTPDGSALLTAREKTVEVWDWPADRRRRVVAVPSEPLSAAVSPDSATAVVGLSSKSGASLIDLRTGAVTGLGLKLHWFSRVAGFATGGREVCGTVGTDRAETWAVPAGDRTRTFEAPPRGPTTQFYQLGFAVSPDGRRAASAQSDGGVAVYETATGQMLAHFHGHREGALSLAWLPGGDRLLSAGGDHQVLVWDVSLRALGGRPAPLPAGDRQAAWDRLKTEPAKNAARTLAALAADPAGFVALAAAEFRPVAAAPAETLDRLFRELDDGDFGVRARASRELEALGAGAVGGVRARRAVTNSDEVRQRADAFLRKYDRTQMSPDRVRLLRALDGLAAVGSPEARRLVAELAGGATEIWQTEAARQALRAMGPADPR